MCVVLLFYLSDPLCCGTQLSSQQSHSIGAWAKSAGTFDPHYEAASCPPSRGYNLFRHVFTEGVPLSRFADSTLHSNCLHSICVRRPQHKRDITRSFLLIEQFDLKSSVGREKKRVWLHQRHSPRQFTHVMSQTYALHVMVTTELRYECITLSFLIDEYLITELFSGYIVNFVKQVRLTSPDMMLVNEELYAVQGWNERKRFERCG
ncbi:hypothetical protein TNCV_3175191 [Trichonephila clavipes]|nr:hypothetical protein TNCV_3175191 [Trichonephila clavipes]